MNLSRYLRRMQEEMNASSILGLTVFTVLAECYPDPVLRCNLSSFPALQDIPETTMSRLLKNLVKVGLISKSHAYKDERTCYLHLTDKGERLWHSYLRVPEPTLHEASVK